ncbi:MAG: hypothetical protein ACRD3D_06880 [Terriglobia bacterium]
MRRRLVLIAVAIAVMLPLSVFADPVTGELFFNGNVTATVTSLNFLCDSPGGPSCSSGQGNFQIQPGSTGTFAGMSGSYGFIKDISNSTTPPGSTVSVPDFLTFQLAPGLSFTITKLNLGTGPACPALPACTPTSPLLVSASNPTGKTGTVFTQNATGTTATDSINADAVLTSATGQTLYTGTFTAPFNGMTINEVLAELSSTGSISNHDYSADFTPVPTTITPEPGTASLFVIAGLLLLAGAGVRRFSHS